MGADAPQSTTALIDIPAILIGTGNSDSCLGVRPIGGSLARLIGRSVDDSADKFASRFVGRFAGKFMDKSINNAYGI